MGAQSRTSGPGLGEAQMLHGAQRTYRAKAVCQNRNSGLGWMQELDVGPDEQVVCGGGERGTGEMCYQV